MNLDLSGKSVVVTGGSKGIGYACAAAFLAEGASVALVSRSRENLDAALARLPRGARAVAIVADLRLADEALRMAAEAERALGPIDVLINSAGAARRTAPDDLAPQAWHDAMDAKFFTYIHPMQAILPGMAARGRGVVVNIIGMGGKVANPVHLPGGSANAALMLATAGLAAAYGPRGIRINGVNPGTTLTGRMQEGLAVEAKMTGKPADELLAAQQARIPLRRLGTPEEVARVTLFLASEQASYVTGALVPMDGGANPVI